MTLEERALDIATRIEGAIRRLGHGNPEKAKEAIGPVGWEVVNRLGGWISVCDFDDKDLVEHRKLWERLATLFIKEGVNP
jgi:hypothetical protein